MSLPYFFTESISAENQFVLPEETSRHCIQVLRMQQGEPMVLADGKGNLVTATILTTDRKQCAVAVTGRKHEGYPTRKTAIAISLLKNTSRFEWFLEKAAEIGISEIIPLTCKRTEKQYFRAGRMQQILVSAMLQSRQSWLPQLHEPQPFEKVAANNNYVVKLIAHCEEDKKKHIAEAPMNNDTLILIGPEGDFTETEIGLALKHSFIPVSLGGTRLRTETAGIAAAVLIKNIIR